MKRTIRKKFKEAQLKCHWQQKHMVNSRDIKEWNIQLQTAINKAIIEQLKQW
ncbi:hypothetical protein TanjilG_11989 [Lupinus angustifolius]|nr:hypothetical protein TanjilG_11989 [Lupinus angustifolius]